MAKAGVSGSVEVKTHTDNTDSWADYTGYIVTAESKELLERASKNNHEHDGGHDDDDARRRSV
jgi:ribosomal 30S subunit maturation factor RimM